MTRSLMTLSLAALLIGCGASSSPGAIGSGADDPVSAPAGDNGDSSRSRTELREPEEGLVDVYARRFDRHKAEGRRVTLFYVSGLDECYGLDRIKIQERKRKVVLTVFEGGHPDAEACPDLGVYVRSIARLQRPLGDRKVVDGAR